MKVTNESQGFPLQELVSLGGDPDLPEGATPDPSCCDVDETTPPIDRAEDTGATFIWEEPVLGDGSLVQDAAAQGVGANVDITMAGDVVAGNTLILLITERSATEPDEGNIRDLGYARINDPFTSSPAHNGGASSLWYKIADGTEGDTLNLNFTSAEGRRGAWAEFTGTFVLDDSVWQSTESNASSDSIGPVTVGPALLVVGWDTSRQTGPHTDTLGDSFTELDNGVVNGAAGQPTHLLGYRIVTAGTYSSSITMSASTNGRGAVLAVFVQPVDDEAWVAGGDEAIDGDDATCVTIDGPNVMRIDLGAAFPITGVRLLFGSIPAGSKSYTLKAANEPDFSDEVTVATLSFTATGTDDEVVETFTTPVGSYRYWELTGPDESRDLCSFELLQSFFSPSGGALEVDADGTPVVATATTLDFQHGLDVADGGGGVAEIDVDETELDHSLLANLTYGDPHTQYRLEADNHTHQSSGAQGGTLDHGAALTGLSDFDHDQYVRGTHGGREAVNTVAASGSTETLDLATANVHDVTLTADCTFTLTGAVAGKACYMSVILRQDGTGSRLATWPGSVTWLGGAAPVLSTTPAAVDAVSFVTVDGGTNWIGVGGGSVDAHIADGSDAHDAGAISIADVGGYYAGTDVEAALQEIGAGGIGGGGGGEDTSYSEVASAGSTETIDCSTARVHHVLLDANCTITLMGPVDNEAHRVTILLQQDAVGSRTVTWPASVYWPGASTPTLATTASYTDWVDLITVDGGDHWLGVLNAAAYHTPAPPAPGGGNGTSPFPWTNLVL